MGHAIDYRVFKAERDGKAPVDSMLAWAEGFSSANTDRLENPSGSYHGNFRQLSGRTFKSRREAEEYLNGMTGDYQDGYVTFLGSEPDSQKYQDAVWKLQQLRQKKSSFDASYVRKLHTRRYQMITCKGCGASIDAYHVRTCFCPKCGYDLRDQQTRKQSEGYGRRIEKAEQKVRDLEDGDQIMYMAKVEVHC